MSLFNLTCFALWLISICCLFIANLRLITSFKNRFNLGGPTYNAAYLTKYLEPEFETILVGGEKDISEESSKYILEKLNIKSIVIPEMRRSINPFLDWKSYWKIVALIKEHKPDIVHFHTVVPYLSFSVIAASYIMGAPIVQTLHNGRWLCLEGGLFRNNTFCLPALFISSRQIHPIDIF